jgi:hypothetical protein
MIYLVILLFNFTFRFDRLRKVLIINDDWFVTIKENLEDNWEKNISISFLSPPHIKQRRIRRWIDFWVLVGINSPLNKRFSSDVLSWSSGMLLIESPSRLIVGITKLIIKKKECFFFEFILLNIYDRYLNEVFSEK